MHAYVHTQQTRDIDECLDDILGLAVLKFRPLHKIHLLGFYTGIIVGLSIFHISFLSTFIVYLIVLT